MVRERKMTDILMLLIFVAFIVAMGFCTVFSFKNGKVKKLTAPLDGDNNFCGVTTGYEGYDRLYLIDLKGSVQTIFNSGVCVKACPVKKGDAIDAKSNNKNTNVSDLKAKYPTRNVAGYCFPSSTDAIP